MALYLVTITSKPTASQPGEMFTVKYEAPNYTESWVGARTVCRLGTIFKDDARLKNPNNAREFWNEDGTKFEITPAVFTVRSIFVEGTRKTGKQRMTNLTYSDLSAVLEGKGIKISKKLDEMLSDLIGNSDGLRVTVATARRLGLKSEEE